MNFFHAFGDLTFPAALCAGLSVVFSTFVIINFLTEISSRYKDRYIEETQVEYEDILLAMPPGRIFDLSLAVGALGAFLGIGLVTLFSVNVSVQKLLFACVVGAIAAFPVPRLILRRMKKQRLAKFNEQLEDALLSMSGSLKAGFSIVQALELIARENRHPISFEFTVLTQELRLGIPFEQALEKMSKRVGSPDFELVSVAIITARQTGGELTGVLERLAAVIRERVRIQQKIQALTAQGRMQANLISVMPFLLMFAMMKIAPDMMNVFFDSIIGLLVISGVILLVVLGYLTIRKITTIDV